ncbi:MAG: class I SAM-dependent methyltransferase [Endomicrobiales bacterium]|nr:class I SAM-dependent methyltransferase [Endomicrobiales bacterium]
METRSSSIFRLKRNIKQLIPIPLVFLYRLFRFRTKNTVKDFVSLIKFLLNTNIPLSFSNKLSLVRKFDVITDNIECAHSHHEIIELISELFLLPKDIKGCIAEAGSFKGGGTAKLSIVAKMLNRKLFVFDSFEGIPKHNEFATKNLYIKQDAFFTPGSFEGTLDEVKNNVSNYGVIDNCEFIKGWFENTLPGFSESIVVLSIDVDLASSTKTCLKHLYPLLVPNGILYSHDIGFDNVAEIFGNDDFWIKEVGCPKPKIKGLKKEHTAIFRKP